MLSTAVAGTARTTVTASVVGVDLMFDVIRGDTQKRWASLFRAGGTLVTIAGSPKARSADGMAVDFGVESDRRRSVREQREP